MADRVVRTPAGEERFGKTIGEPINPRTSIPGRDITVHGPWVSPTYPPSITDTTAAFSGKLPPAVEGYRLPPDHKTATVRRKDAEQ